MNELPNHKYIHCLIIPTQSMPYDCNYICRFLATYMVLITICGLAYSTKMYFTSTAMLKQVKKKASLLTKYSITLLVLNDLSRYRCVSTVKVGNVTTVI